MIDTANVYADGRSEEIAGKALENHVREDLVVATKVRFIMGEGPNDEGLSRKHVLQECRANLDRLGLDRIDLYYLYTSAPLTPIKETMRALKYLVQSLLLEKSMSRTAPFSAGKASLEYALR